MADDASTTVSYRGDRLAGQPPHSATVLRGKLDAHLGEKVAERGAFVIPSTPVRELVLDDDRVTGVKAGEETFAADVVVLATGALSLLAPQAGLEAPLTAERFAVGVKEVRSLERSRLEDRFGLEASEGEARLFVGAVTGGQMGGGFLYTNAESISLGIVLGLGSYCSATHVAGTAELLEAFKERPELRPLLRDTKLEEYSAHVIPEGGLDAAPARVKDGLLLLGDAAGLCLNHGLTVRGMDLALASGVLAARAILAAREKGDFSATGLAAYNRLLEESFVLQDMKTFRNAPRVLGRDRFYTVYPREVCDLLGELFFFGEGPKARLFSTAWSRFRREFLSLNGLADAWKARRL
jgi:electron transfer flavoprotein-quinone oxidoreductase